MRQRVLHLVSPVLPVPRHTALVGSRVPSVSAGLGLLQLLTTGALRGKARASEPQSGSPPYHEPWCKLQQQSRAWEGRL